MSHNDRWKSAEDKARRELERAARKIGKRGTAGATWLEKGKHWRTAPKRGWS